MKWKITGRPFRGVVTVQNEDGMEGAMFLIREKPTVGAKRVPIGEVFGEKRHPRYGGGTPILDTKPTVVGEVPEWSEDDPTKGN